MSCLTKSFKISDLFLNKRGNPKFTKTYCNLNKGKYEVFTGTTIGSFGFINTFEYEGEHLTYTTDGYAGTLKVLSGKFNIGGHRAVLIPLIKGINLYYFEYKLQNLFFDSVKKGSIPSLSWGNVKNLSIELPIDENGDLDLHYQNEIANKIIFIKEVKDRIIEKINILHNVNINIQDKEHCKMLPIEQVLDFTHTTNSSKFTKTFIQKNIGDIPVYGASKEDFPTYGYVKDFAEIQDNKNIIKVKYFENCLTYNIDGFAGYIFYRKGRFTISEKVRPLIIKDQYKDLINPMYLKIVLEPLFRGRIKGRIGNNGKGEYSKLNMSMVKDINIPIPVNENGYIDLKAQDKIVNDNATLEAIRNQLFKKVEFLSNSIFVFDNI